MPASSAAHRLESLAQQHAASVLDPRTGDVAARTQYAFVRALLDEVRRHPASDAIVGALLAQVDEEIARLARLAAAPASEVRLRVA